MRGGECGGLGWVGAGTLSFSQSRRVSWYFWSMNYVLRMRYSLFSSKSRHVLLPSNFVHITAWGPLVMVLNGVGRYQAQLALCLSVCLSVEICMGLSGFPVRKLSVGCCSGRARCAGKRGAVPHGKELSRIQHSFLLYKLCS